MLDIHPASDAERVEVYRNVHDVWGRGLPMDEHVRRRLASPQHNRAEWFVGIADGRVATSLGVYSVAFRYFGDVIPGMAIGAVHTHSDFRGRGYAPELIDWVERVFHSERGTAIGLLYSDILPGYYARLGYVECPAWELDFDLATVAELPNPVNPHDVHTVPLADAGPLMSELYDDFHRDRAISIHRPADYWEFLRTKAPHDLVFACGSSNDSDGYVRVGLRDSSLIVRDAAFPGNRPVERMMGAVARIARDVGATHVTGWVPQLDAEFAHRAVRRTEEITMLKSLSPEFPIDATVTTAADWFHEIDHV